MVMSVMLVMLLGILTHLAVLVGNKAKVRGSNQIIHNVPKCKPELSEGRDSKLEIHGYTFLECDFETCSDVYKITYVRKFEDSETWVVVFDGVNAPLHHKHGNNHAYSLTNRTHYAPFDTQHTLSINPLLSDDEGDWRCVVHDKEGNLVMSQTMKIDLENPVKGIIKVVPKIRIVIQTHTLKYLCEMEHNYVEPPIVWMLNGTDIESENDKVYQQDDPLYVKSVLTLTKEKARNSTIECKIKYKGKSGQWTWNSIAVDIEVGAKYDTSTQKSDIQITFIVFIIVLILVVIVLMIALCHLVQKLRKLETTAKHESARIKIMEDLDDADLRPGA